MPRAITHHIGIADLKRPILDVFYDYKIILYTALNTYPNRFENDYSSILNRFDFNCDLPKHSNRLYITCDFNVLELMVIDTPVEVLNNLEDNHLIYQYNDSPDYRAPHMWIFKDDYLKFWSPISSRFYGEILDTFKKENLVDRTMNRFRLYTSQVPRKKSTKP